MSQLTGLMQAIKFIIDTWLKTSTAQGSELPDSQRQFIDARTVLPLASFANAGNNHVKITLGTDSQGQQISFKGRNTWYVYDPAVDIFQVPVVDAYTLRFEVTTWLKQRPIQSSDLPETEKVLVQSNTVLPIAAFQFEQNHVKVTLGRDSQGQQITFQGRNTWYAYQPHVDVLLNGIPLFGYTLRVETDTWLKQSTAQAVDLSPSQKEFVRSGTVFPIAAFSIESAHIKFTLGQDATGDQITIDGRNTWYIYRPAAEIFQNGRPFNPTLTTNAKGLRLIKEFEGLSLVAYQDAVGVWTIGYGTTRGVYPGMRITLEQAEEFLRRDLQRFESAVNQLVRVPLNADQFSALVSFVYNVGEGAFADSTLLAKLNRGDYDGASDEFLRWVYAGGRVLPGLERRRRAERALFRGEDFTRFL